MQNLNWRPRQSPSSLTPKVLPLQWFAISDTVQVCTYNLAMRPDICDHTMATLQYRLLREEEDLGRNLVSA
jgi:hypothetical protein